MFKCSAFNNQKMFLWNKNIFAEWTTAKCKMHKCWIEILEWLIKIFFDIFSPHDNWNHRNSCENRLSGFCGFILFIFHMGVWVTRVQKRVGTRKKNSEFRTGECEWWFCVFDVNIQLIEYCEPYWDIRSYRIHKFWINVQFSNSCELGYTNSIRRLFDFYL